MRYPDGGGLTGPVPPVEGAAAGRADVRAGYGRGGQIAGLLRVSTKPVYSWRRDWRAGGEAALASKGPGGNAGKLDGGPPWFPEGG